jgi:hypothetical protein
LRRFFESYVMWFKQDLRLSEVCKSTREKLLTYLTDQNVFLDSITAEFRGNVRLPFRISANEPPQISSLKKLLNALEHAQSTFESIEDLDINRSRHSLGLTKDAAKLIWDGIHEFYGVLQLVNQGTQDVQMIVGPHLNELMPKLGLALERLKEYSPERSAEAYGTNFADLVRRMPPSDVTSAATVAHLSNAVARLPHYLEKLQQLINFTEAPLKSSTDAAEFQQVMLARAAELNIYLQKSATQSGWGVVSSYFSTVSALLEHSADLLNTSAPLTKQAYTEAVAKLNAIRHQYLPKMLADLEAIEESLGLKPSSLTEPMVQRLESYYETLAAQVNKIAVAAEVIEGIPDSTMMDWTRYLLSSYKRIDVGAPLKPVEDLDVLRDEIFMKQLIEQRSVRLAEAEIEQQDGYALNAAKRFFSKLEKYGSLYQASCKWSLFNLNEEDKQWLKQEYKLFQAHFARIYPEVDKVIVDSLTRKNSNPFWALRFYEALTDANQFTSVLACKATVIGALEQQKAHGGFKVKVVQEASNLRERYFYEANGSNTVLETTPAPYIPLTYAEMPGQSINFYVQKQKITAMERHTLQRALAGLDEFFTYLRENFEHENLELRDGRIDQEILRKALQKFQSQFVNVDERLYQRLAAVLNSPDKTQDGLKITELLTAKRTLADALNQGIAAYREQESRHAAYVENAKDHENKDKLLVAAQTTGFAHCSFLTMVHNLKLSQSLDTFLKETFRPYLEANLDPIVLNQLSFETADLPYLSFHKDAPDVAMYKRVINAFYHLHKGLVTLESAKDKEDANYLIGRSRFVWDFVQPLVYELYCAKYYLTEAAENPGLNTIIHEGLQVLEPLQNLPIIGDLLQNVPAPVSGRATARAQAVNVVGAWKTQQDVVLRVLESHSRQSARPRTAPRQTPIETREENSAIANLTLDQVIEALYTIPTVLEGLRRDPQEMPDDADIRAKTRALVTSLRGLKNSPWSLQALLQDIHELHTVLNSVGTVSRALVLQQVGMLQEKIAADVFQVVDTVEFEMGLSPGALSNSLMQQFSSFYHALVVNLPFEDDQQLLKLEVNLNMTRQRLAKERERLASITADREPEHVRDLILGNNEELSSTMRLKYWLLKLITTTPGFELEERLPQPLLPIQNAINEWYAEVRPYLLQTEAAPRFTEDFISQHDNEEDLRTAVEELQEMQSAFNYKEGVIDKLLTMFYFGEPFTDPSKDPNPQRDEFLRLYQQIQPYLFEIDYQYDMKYFLRELRTAEDFDEALRVLVGPKGVLEGASDIAKEMWGGIKQFLRELRTAEDFKETLRVMVGQLEGARDLAKEMLSGTDNSSVRDKNKLVELVEGRENSRNQRIEQCQRRIQFLQDQLAHESEQSLSKVENFKHNVFTNYVHTEVLNSFTDPLGPYADHFFKKILPTIEYLEETLLEDISIEDDIQGAIASSIDNTITKRVIPQFRQIYKAYSELNAEFQNIKTILDGEHDVQPNPRRAEKNYYLKTVIQQVVSAISSRDPHKISVQEIYEYRNRAKNAMKQNKSFDAMIVTHDLLMEMRQHISGLDAGLEVNRAKIGQIDLLLSTLGDMDISPKERMNKIADYGLGERFNNIMGKDADNFLLRALKALTSFLFNWQSENEKALGKLKNTLLEVKENDDPTDDIEIPRSVN